MIRGYCIGGGLVTALQADIRIAADDGQFAIPAARLGLGYGFDGVKELVSLVGPAMARRSCSRPAGSPRPRPGAWAWSTGWCRSTSSRRRGRARGQIAANAPLTVAAAKAAIREMVGTRRRDLARVEQMIEACFRSGTTARAGGVRGKTPPPSTGR